MTHCNFLAVYYYRWYCQNFYKCYCTWHSLEYWTTNNNARF